MGISFLLEIFSLMVERLKSLIVCRAWNHNQMDILAAAVQVTSIAYYTGNAGKSL